MSHGHRKNKKKLHSKSTETVTGDFNVAAPPTNDSQADQYKLQAPRTRNTLSRESTIAMCTLVVSILIAAIYLLQLLAMRDTVHQMQIQTRLAVRPFVGLDEGSSAIQNTPLHIDDAGNASLEYKILLKNYSNSPASNVWGYANLVVADDLHTAYEQEEYACADALIGKPDVGLMLFPSRDRVFNSMPATTKVSIKHKQSIIWVFLAGCIGYRDQFGFLYRTRFLYSFRDDNGQGVTFMEPVHGTDISGHFVPIGGSTDEGQIPKFNSP